MFLAKAFKQLTQIFKPCSYQDSLERYIAEKKPTSLVEIERLQKKFEHSSCSWWNSKLC